jgi:hypothetical protein
LLPERGRAVWLGRMNEKKRRLIDDDVVVCLIYDVEVEIWVDGLMEEGICGSSKYIDHSVTAGRIPVLDLADKTALPKTLQP